MGIHRGPNPVNDGLTFGCDTGYGIADNDTATRFYPGEATANIFPNPNFANHTDVTVGTTSVIKQDFGDGRIGIQMIQAGTSDIAGFSMGSYSAPVSAGTYTWSSFIHSTSTGGKVKAQITVYVNGTRHWLTNSNTWTTSVTECSHLFIATVANQWHRIENQFTLPTGTLTNLQLGSFYRTTSNFTIKIANAQLELKSHTTPFVDGTRSSTASLIDLKRATSIDVSNVSFDSTGQPTFDNSDDRITMPNSAVFNHTSQLTIESWVKFDGNSADFIFEKGNVNTQYSLFSHGTDIVFRTWHAGDSGYQTLSPSKTTAGITNGVWHHIVGSWDGSTKRIYVDGVDKASVSKSGALTTNSNGAAIGSFGGTSSGYYFGGDIAIVRIYDKGLSADEVKQNYNAYKNRFDV
jgi:hypothetical protein